MLRYLPIVVELALLVYCLIDCIQTEAGAERNLNKTVWIFIIILIPIAGPVAWLVAGRPTKQGAGRSVPWPSTQTAGFPEYERPAPPRGPDDDPEFLAGIARKEQAEHERLLAEWEAQLREREARLRPPSDDDEGTRPADEDKRPADS
ncbi:PLDc N-terminal domain-containing protein [Actinotalea ferrariae]|uniref:PLDc N-terminal domain-containing protein n=1 Tax=Actinotalea ferrariae TaxID=1386098 RepID=UPI001C8B8683|nr:PLDc N-terminal domain-containing protein [Actinotalea ferrariae]MBX9246598.1 PLDc N-terminal domain-containing protein [Actinotalea ferrariae]